MNKLLAVTAFGEAVTGLILLVYPPIVVRLLFGAEIAGAGMVMSRIAGISLIALGLACWPDRQAGGSVAPAFRGMFTYSLVVTIYLIYIGAVEHLAGILLWPAVAVHAILMLLLVGAWLKERKTLRTKP